MKVVVTGGAGFIGANLCRELSEREDVTAITVIDDLSTGFEANLDGLDVELVKGSILDDQSIRHAISGAHAIVHLAARPSVPRSIADPVASHEANATGTLRVLEAARVADSPPSVIVASSSSVYGANPTLPKREDLRPMPMSPYAVSKLAAENYALSHQLCYGIRTIAFRFFNVFGPLQPAGHAYAAVVPTFISAALAGRRLPLHGGGEQSRDFTYVGTVARILATAAVDQTTSPEPINLAFGTRTSLMDLIAILEELFDCSMAIDRMPARPGDVKHSQADNSSLMSLFPDASPVDLRTGLQATLDWFRSTTS